MRLAQVAVLVEHGANPHAKTTKERTVNGVTFKVGSSAVTAGYVRVLT